jgi:hypothetical protein
MTCSLEFVFNPLTGKFEFIMIDTSGVGPPTTLPVSLQLVDNLDRRLHNENDDLITQGT